LDFIGGPILTFPPIGDIPNAIITGLLFAITRNKRSAAAVNLIKFVPIVGDYIPTYTVTTLMWIYTEWNKKNEMLQFISGSIPDAASSTLTTMTFSSSSLSPSFFSNCEV